jgi:hypothetical protein
VKTADFIPVGFPLWMTRHLPVKADLSSGHEGAGDCEGCQAVEFHFSMGIKLPDTNGEVV